MKEPGGVEAAGRGERPLGLEQSLRQGATTDSASRTSLSTRGASTRTASIAPFPQTPQEDEV